MSAVATRSYFKGAWDVASDLLIATALIWALPLLIAVLVGALTLLLKSAPPL